MRLYLRYISIILRSQMQHKASFLMSFVSQFLSSFVIILGLYFLFSRFNQVEGFSYHEILLCYAIIFMAFSLAECFFRGFDTFSTIVSKGEFDRMMVRPRSELFQVLASRMELSRIGRILQALLTFVYVLPKCEILWSPDKVLTLMLMLFGGMFLFSGLFMIYASFCFFTIEGLEFMNIFTDGGREFGKFPLSIYGRWVLRFFTYIVPLALVQYYPLLYLLGRTEQVLYLFLPLLGALFLIPSYAFWRFGIRRYKSSGS